MNEQFFHFCLFHCLILILMSLNNFLRALDSITFTEASLMPSNRAISSLEQCSVWRNFSTCSSLGGSFSICSTSHLSSSSSSMWFEGSAHCPAGFSWHLSASAKSDWVFFILLTTSMERRCVMTATRLRACPSSLSWPCRVHRRSIASLAASSASSADGSIRLATLCALARRWAAIASNSFCVILVWRERKGSLWSCVDVVHGPRFLANGGAEVVFTAVSGYFKFPFDYLARAEYR